MNKIKFISFALIIFFAASFYSFASSESDEHRTKKLLSKNTKNTIKWYDYEEGMGRGKNENKKIFLNFYAEWCGYCQTMDNKTFKDDSIISYLNKNFIAIKVNSDKDRKIAGTYKVRGLPSTWFITENGENIGHQPGYIPPEEMLPLLKYINTESYKTMSFTKFRENM